MVKDTNNSVNQESVMNCNDLIVKLFEDFIENGGSPKVTEFKRHVDGLIKSGIKPLCGGRGKSSGDGGYTAQ